MTISATDAPRPLSITRIILERRFQVRVKMDANTVEKYRKAIDAGIEMPPVEVAQVKGTLILVDGWHRLTAAKLAGKQRINANVIEASEAEAAWLAVQANLKHGLPLKSADVCRAFQLYVKARKHRDAKGRLKPYRTIAMELGGQPSHVTVMRWMKRHFPKIAMQYAGTDAPGSGGLREPRRLRIDFHRLAHEMVDQIETAYLGIEEDSEKRFLKEKLERLLKRITDDSASWEDDEF
jgi:ParB-like chromosome segregation protein Spo0J